MTLKSLFNQTKNWLQQLSFRTGVIILLCCIPCYIFSFAQMALPFSLATKGVLWTIFYGLAKTFQYTGILILGPHGYRKVKDYIKRCKKGLHLKPEMLEGIRLVIFDFDGTLGDSQQLIVDTMMATVKQLGLPHVTRAQCASTIGLPLKECFTTILTLTDEEAEACRRTYTEIFTQREVPGAVKSFPGVEKQIEELAKQGIEMAIASSRNHASLVKLVGFLKLENYITHIIGADDVQQPKPHAEPVLKLMQLYRVGPAQTLVIGDTEFDILMGRNAGAHTCGVTYGNGSKESLVKAGAEWIVD